MPYKRNQIEEAILRTLVAHGERQNELKFRIKRLLVTDRQLGRNVKSAREEDHHYAFFGGEPPGSGTEIKFSPYEAFALLAAVNLLEHGLPQERVVRIMRLVRRPFEAAHEAILKKDPAELFDHLPRHLLFAMIAYRTQAEALGDLDTDTARLLRNVGAARSGPEVIPLTDALDRRRRKLPPGTVLTREWNGHNHRVMVVAEGFAWEGRTYDSLSKIA